MKFEIYNYLPDTTLHANFRGLRRRGWSEQIASLTHESYCPFLLSSPRPQVAPLDVPPRSTCHYASFWPRYSAFWVLERWKEIWPLNPPKT